MTEEKAIKTPAVGNTVMDKVFCYISMALLVFLPIAEIITELLKASKIKTFRRWYPSIWQPYIVGVFGGILALVVIISFIVRIKNGKFKLYAADVFFFTLMFFMLLSMFCSVNFGVFAGGSKFYCERPEIFLCYFCLFFAGSMIENPDLRRRALYAYIVVALIEGIVAYFQTHDMYILDCLFSANKTSYSASWGTLQNTNFYGSLSVVLTAATSGFFIFSSRLGKSKICNSKIVKWIVYALSMLVFYTLLACAARLAWVGMIGVILTYVISLIMMRKSSIAKEDLKKITINFGIVLAGYVVIILYSTFGQSYVADRIEATTQDTVSAIGTDEFGDGRGAIWRAALSSVPRHPLTGIGLDNLAQCFREMPGWQEGDYVQDKGHCEYIHLLATQGIPAFINYMTLLIFATVNSVKAILKEEDEAKRSLLWIFITIFAGYASQAVFSSSIMNVAPYFWFILGILTPRTKPLFNKKG